MCNSAGAYPQQTYQPPAAAGYPQQPAQPYPQVDVVFNRGICNAEYRLLPRLAFPNKATRSILVSLKVLVRIETTQLFLDGVDVF